MKKLPHIIPFLLLCVVSSLYGAPIVFDQGIKTPSVKFNDNTEITTATGLGGGGGGTLYAYTNDFDTPIAVTALFASVNVSATISNGIFYLDDPTNFTIPDSTIGDNVIWFDYQGSVTQSWVAPANVTNVFFRLRGGGGGDSGQGGTTYISVNPPAGAAFELLVAEGGYTCGGIYSNKCESPSFYGFGGYVRDTNHAVYTVSPASAGGCSVLRLIADGETNVIAVAGGGGSHGFFTQYRYAGDGGGEEGQTYSTAGMYGFGGTQTAGGQGGFYPGWSSSTRGESGSKWTGGRGPATNPLYNGTSPAWGGPGGNGWYGGGSGVTGSSSQQTAGGGGGSGYVNVTNPYVYFGVTTVGHSIVNDAYLSTIYGSQGSRAENNRGGYGRIVVQY